MPDESLHGFAPINDVLDGDTEIAQTRTSPLKDAPVRKKTLVMSGAARSRRGQLRPVLEAALNAY
ncbi:hypothetical protein [Arthrobacter sp. 131MFCol6.1]|uniref:hypothetical protein n=1 Tax=Arthrobacter sp. 131MFCol6.1 TaxID=1157944 RepID=UPI0012DD8387|nr:hypothetical protein [Arthrobacter sp. 131MFCol6.1]